MLAPRRCTILIASLLLSLVGCTKARDEGKGDLRIPDPGSVNEHSANQAGAHRQPAAPSSRGLEPQKNNQPDPSESKNGTRYLIILGSWKVRDHQSPTYLPEEWVARPEPQSVKMAVGFPRATNAQESTVLRSGYGALLAGVCADSASADGALKALRAEGFDAYSKETQLNLPTHCPSPSQQWKIDHELLLAAESDKPDALAAVTDLLDQGASPQGIGARSPLDLAAYRNDVSLAHLLLRRGAQPNRSQRAPQQESALELSLRTPYGDPFEMVQLLVKYGADVNAHTEGAEADPGSTVQIAAIRGCYPQILSYLREKGAKPHPVSADEVCRDRLPSESAKSELLDILRGGSESR